MIRFPCDKCERLLVVPDEDAGQKVECPNCGDVNVVPLRGGASGGAGAPAEEGLAESDVSQETVLLFVRPSTWRSRPILAAALALGPLVAAGLAAAFGPSAWMSGGGWVWWWVVGPVAGWLGLAVLWVFVSGRLALEVTSRRCTRIDGLLLKDRRDVFHRDVQSVTIAPRGVFDRLLNVGDLEISSDESDAVEIRAPGLARPGKVKATIDPFVGRWRKR